MDKANPWSRCCKRKSLSNEGIFMILPPQYFPWLFNLMILYLLDTLQLTQEKEKSSVAQCSTG